MAINYMDIDYLEMGISELFEFYEYVKRSGMVADEKLDFLSCIQNQIKKVTGI